jgi:hypothetical protein
MELDPDIGGVSSGSMMMKAAAANMTTLAYRIPYDTCISYDTRRSPSTVLTPKMAMKIKSIDGIISLSLFLRVSAKRIL